jgi:hypothetical protein
MAGQALTAKGIMRASMRLFVGAAVCFSGLCVVLVLASGGVAAAPGANVSGIWLAYVPPSVTNSNQTFVMRDVGNRITGTWQGEFKLTGTYSPSTGVATLCAGCQQTGVGQTTNWKVKFTFKSTSTAQSNHPTFKGTYHYVTVSTGAVVPGSTAPMRALRCSYQANAKATALCG